MEQPIMEQPIAEQPVNDGMRSRFDDRRERRSHREHRGGGIVWPVILIGAGAIFLLNNVGTLNWNVWYTLGRLWPVILIAIGLDILIGRRSLAGSLLVALLVLGVMAAAVFYWTPPTAAAIALGTQQINQGLEGATRASVDISVGTATLTIKEGSEAAGLVQGTIMLADNEHLQSPAFTKSGDTADFRLRTQQVNPIRWFSDPGLSNKRWDLQLNPDVPMSLRIDAGVGNGTLDLSHLKITDFRASAGVGNLSLTLPRSGQLTASMDAGVGRIDVLVPAGMAARIRVDRGLGGVDVGNGFQRRGENEYVTAGYDTATNRVDMKINGGIGHISIEQQAGG